MLNNPNTQVKPNKGKSTKQALSIRLKAQDNTEDSIDWNFTALHKFVAGSVV